MKGGSAVGSDDGRRRIAGDLGAPGGADFGVERAGGFLPPLIGVSKRVRGARGETRFGPFPVWPFRVEEREEGRFALVYRWPFSTLVDEVWAGPGESWLGRSTLFGREIGRFRMTRSRTRAKEVERVAQDRLRRKLVEYVQNVHALEQNVLLMLDSMILNTPDEEIVGILREHRMESRLQERRLRERLEALGGRGISAAGKDLAAIAVAQAKGVADVFRSDKAVQNGRDAFVTEHLEIAAYELLERLAERAGDPETAEVARRNRAEEQAMAERIAARWDRFLDLTLSE